MQWQPLHCTYVMYTVACNVLCMHCSNLSIPLTQREALTSPLVPEPRFDHQRTDSVRCRIFLLQPRYIPQAADRETEIAGFGVDSGLRSEGSLRINVTRGGCVFCTNHTAHTLEAWNV
jgi:hypothetical protein